MALPRRMGEVANNNNTVRNHPASPQKQSIVEEDSLPSLEDEAIPDFDLTEKTFNNETIENDSAQISSLKNLDEDELDKLLGLDEIDDNDNNSSKADDDFTFDFDDTFDDDNSNNDNQTIPENNNDNQNASISDTIEPVNEETDEEFIFDDIDENSVIEKPINENNTTNDDEPFEFEDDEEDDEEFAFENETQDVKTLSVDESDEEESFDDDDIDIKKFILEELMDDDDDDDEEFTFDEDSDESDNETGLSDDEYSDLINSISGTVDPDDAEDDEWDFETIDKNDNEDEDTFTPITIDDDDEDVDDDDDEELDFNIDDETEKENEPVSDDSSQSDKPLKKGSLFDNLKKKSKKMKKQIMADMRGQEAPEDDDEEEDGAENNKSSSAPRKSKTGKKNKARNNKGILQLLRKILSVFNPVKKLYMFIVGLFFKILTTVLGILSSLPLIGKLIKPIAAATKILEKIALSLPIVAVIAVLCFVSYKSVPTSNTIMLPDDGSVTISGFSYDSKTGNASAEVKNTGEIIASDMTPKFEIYALKPTINPKSWIIPVKVKECTGSLTTIDIDSVETVSTNCENHEGLLTRASGTIQ